MAFLAPPLCILSSEAKPRSHKNTAGWERFLDGEVLWETQPPSEEAEERK